MSKPSIFPTKRLIRVLAIFATLAALGAGRVVARTGRFGPALQQSSRTSAPQKPPSNQPAPTTPAPAQTPSGGGRGYGPVPGPLPTGPRGDFSPWWKDATIIKEVGLSTDQVNRIDRIYEKRRKQIQLHVDELDTQTAELNKMFSERLVTPEVIELQAQKWMAPRMIIEPSRIRMLYDMSRVMTAEQNTKLQEFFHRMGERNRERGRGGVPR